METHEPASEAVTEQKHETLGEEDLKSIGENLEVAAKMAELQVRDIKQPRLASSKSPEHLLQNVPFTFTPWVPNREKMPELQAGDTKELPMTVAEHPNHILPAFEFELPTHVHRLVFGSQIDKDEDIDQTMLRHIHQDQCRKAQKMRC